MRKKQKPPSDSRVLLGFKTKKYIHGTKKKGENSDESLHETQLASNYDIELAFLKSKQDRIAKKISALDDKRAMDESHEDLAR